MRKAHRFKRIWSESRLYHGTVDKSQRICTKCKHLSVFLSYLYYASCHHGRVTALVGYVHTTINLSLHCLIFVIYVATWSRAKRESDLLTLGRTHWPSVHAVTLIVCFFFLSLLSPKQQVTSCLISAAFFGALGSSYIYGYNLSVVNAPSSVSSSV